MATLNVGRTRVGCVFACVWYLAFLPYAAVLSRTLDQDRAAAESTFAQRIGRYAAVRARFEEPLPSFDARRDPWSLFLTRRYLASAIRTARSRARQGDIFTPEVASMFRDRIAEAVQKVDIEGLVDVEAADFVVDLAVNEMVPAWAMDELPSALVEQLPTLPEAIEYRRVGDALILWDVHAEILIDALPAAFSDA